MATHYGEDRLYAEFNTSRKVTNKLKVELLEFLNIF
jgi:hypothetical protein